MKLPRRRRLAVLGAALLIGAGGIVAANRLSGSGNSAVEVEAAGQQESPATSGPLPSSLLPSSTTATTGPAPSSSSTTLKPKRPEVTAPTATTTTTTTIPACAPTRPLYGFGLDRDPDGNGWAAGGNPALQRSTDGGRTWRPVCLPAEAVTGPGALYGVEFDAAGLHGWVVGGSGGRPVAFRTVDGGDHWLAAVLPVGIAGTLTDVGFADVRRGWAVGNLTGLGPANAAGGVLLGTTDGGLTWSSQALPDGIGRLSRISVVDATHAWAVGVSLAGKPVVIALESGGTWWTQPLPDGIRELRDIAFLDGSRGWAVGALPIPPTAEGGINDPGVVLTTSDGGATWTQQATTTGALWSVDVIDTGTIFAGGGYALFSTRDGGTTWTRQPFTLPALDAISFTDADHGWVTHSMFSVVCRTDDGGRTWIPSVLNPEVTPKPCTPA